MSDVDPHRWLLVAEEDPLETEVCADCGLQRDKTGVLNERALITGGWQFEDCGRATVEEALRPASQREGGE